MCVHVPERERGKEKDKLGVTLNRFSVRGKENKTASRIDRGAKGREDFPLYCVFGTVRIKEGRGVIKSN